MKKEEISQELKDEIEKAHKERLKRNQEIVKNCTEGCQNGKKPNGEQCTCQFLEIN